MKKIIILLAISIFLVSCGKNEIIDQKNNPSVIEKNEVSSDGLLSEDEIDTAINELFID